MSASRSKLEGVHVAAEERLLLLVERPERFAGAVCAESRSGSFESTVYCNYGGAEQIRRLRRLPVEDIAEDEDGALPGGNALQRGDESEPDRLSACGKRRWVARLGQHAAVRDRLDPRRGRQRLANWRIGGCRGSEVGRNGAPLTALEHVQADVGRDPVQPGTKRCAALEALAAAPRVQECFLDGVFRLGRGPEHPVAIPG